MNKEPNVLESAFDCLSSIPYLRQLVKGMWVFSTAFLGYAILIEGIALFEGKVDFRSQWVVNLIMWTGINPFFAYIFHLWKKRETELRTKGKNY